MVLLITIFYNSPPPVQDGPVIRRFGAWLAVSQNGIRVQQKPINLNTSGPFY